MSFGIVQSMIISLRNNSRRKQAAHFDRQQMPLKDQRSTSSELLNKKASPQQLQKIKAKISSENRSAQIRAFLITLFTTLGIILFTYWLFS